MIEATGLVSLIADARSDHVAVPDILQNYAEQSDGQLYHQLLELIGKEVYVLVLPRDEMIELCSCGHIKADHMEFTNWDTSKVFGHLHTSEPDLSPTRSHLTYRGTDRRTDIWCKCNEFKVAQT
jgi:hypothetical protein